MVQTDSQIAHDQWVRYMYMRDNGHLDFVLKANKCDRFYRGDQWDPVVKATLDAVGRPALTINKILSTVNSLTGDQINLRSETTFKPLHANGENLSTVLELLFKQTAQNNMLAWRETDVFEDGAITSRGFYDVRLGFTDSMQGEVVISTKNPRNILIDPDAEEYDPDTWKDTIETKWFSPNDVEVQYGREEAEYLRSNSTDMYAADIDSFQRSNERFGGNMNYYAQDGAAPRIQRNIRVVDRQHKVLVSAKFFVDMNTGDLRPVPEGWDRAKIKLVMDTYRLGVIDKMTERWRWTTTAGALVLHDKWSPYQHNTLVPFFPLFRHGQTIGVVENLLDPQDLLNKVSSQELHVVNSTANGGYILKSGALVSMSVEELEQRGAMTGIVIEVDEIANIEKIQPNQIPTGLERISFKAEEHIKTISNVTDTSLGDDRADVAAKAIKAKSARQGVSQLRLQDNLNRTRYLLAKRVLALFQGFYTEPRIYRITFDNPVAATQVEQTEEDQFIKINQYNDAVGRITNDLTLGEYDIVITTMPPKDTQQESEFEQMVAMKELGIAIPDADIISVSLLRNKRDMIRRMTAAAQSPEAQQQKQLGLQAQVAQVGKLEAEVDQTKADALLKTANAQSKAAEIATAAPGQAAADGGTDLATQVLQNRADRAAQAAEHAQDDKRMNHEAGMQARDQAHEKTVKVGDAAVADHQADKAHGQELEKAAVAHAVTTKQTDQQAKHSSQANKEKTDGAIKVAKAKPKTPPKKAAK